MVVGVSGGPDSVCLLHVLSKMKERLGLRLHVAHLNHGLRGEESDADAEYVSRLASDLSLPCTVEKKDAAAYQSEQHLSLEEAARELRYRFFAEVARAAGADRVAVGHTKDDWVETILMHLIRGTGPWGLQGLHPLSCLVPRACAPITVVRPLLVLRSSETEAYCRHHRLASRTDVSNLSAKFLRNRIRHELIPWLQSCNPEVVDGLVSTAEMLAEEQDFLQKQLSEAWDTVVTKKDNWYCLSREEMSAIHPALQHLLLREVFRRLLGDIKDIERKHIEMAQQAFLLPAGRSVSLPRGLSFYVEYKTCFVGVLNALEAGIPPLERETRLRVPGHTQLPGWDVEARIEAGAKRSWPEGCCDDSSGRAETAYLDFEATGDDIVVRGRRPGDMFQPLGMSKPKKIPDFMVDVHIPRALRDRVPLVCSPQQILWVVGWRVGEGARVRESTRRVLCLRFERVDGS